LEIGNWELKAANVQRYCHLSDKALDRKCTQQTFIRHLMLSWKSRLKYVGLGRQKARWGGGMRESFGVQLHICTILNGQQSWNHWEIGRGG
jgi:hypothetical protein